MKLSGAFLFHPEWAGVRPELGPEFGPEQPEWIENGPVIFGGAFCSTPGQFLMEWN